MNEIRRDYALLFGACPLLAVATDATRAAGLVIVLVIATAVAGLIVAALRIAARGDAGWPAFALVVATAVGVAELALAAWRYPLYRPIAAALPLVVANVAWLAQCRAAPVDAAWRGPVLVGALVMLVGVLRDAPLPAGLANVVATPAGAFILLALLVAARQASSRPATAGTA